MDNIKYTDVFNKKLSIGDTVIYGKSNRHNPINHGIIVDLYYDKKCTKDYNQYICYAKILGNNNVKPRDIELSRSFIYKDGTVSTHMSKRVYLYNVSVDNET
jgi:hypothetical protein